MKRAILLTSLGDVELFNREVDIVGLAGAYPIIQEYEFLNLEYFLSETTIKDVDTYDLVGKVGSGWYRDHNRDVFINQGISIGALLNHRIIIEFASVLRYYLAFRNYIEKYDKILISRNAPKSLCIASKCFSDKIEYFDSEYQFDEHISSSVSAGTIPKPPVHKLASFLYRLAQRPFLRFLKSKTLVINDWTFDLVNNPDCLNINYLNPLRGFCLSSGLEYLAEAESIFPQSLDGNVIYSNVKTSLSEFKINNKLTHDIASLFVELSQEEFAKSRDKILKIYCAYQEMFSYYSPAMVVLPGYAHPYFQMVYGIARSKNIPSMFVQDGYGVQVEQFSFPKDMHNKKHMIDYFAVMGSYVDGLYKKVFKNNDIRTIKILSPIIKTHRNVSGINRGKYAIVIFPYGKLYSPNCKRDQKYKYVLDVVDSLSDMGYDHIRVKMKRGHVPYKKEENLLMKKLLRNRANVEMVFGEFSDYLSNACFVVGYIGTAILESFYRNVPYYVYEPISLGMSDNFIDNSVIINKENISRTIPDLKRSIIDKNFVVLDRDKVFDGVDINEIDFNQIIQDFKISLKDEEVFFE